MRIIAGEFRRRSLFTPPDAEVTRPIPDRVKESLFMILRGHCEGATVFDGFAGIGAIGLEAISRGAARCVLVEKDRRIADILRRNVETLGVEDRCDVVVGDALGPAALARAPRPLHLAFLDPPYPLVREPAGFARVMAQLAGLVALLDDTGYAILRTPWPLVHEVEVWPEGFGPSADELVRAAAHKPKASERTRWKRELEQQRREGFGKKRKKGGPGRGSARRSPSPRDIEGDTGADVDGDGDGLQWLEGEELSEVLAQHGMAPDAVLDGSEDDGTGAASTDVGPTIEKRTPSLIVPGALGPETHVYGGMAVHLYMKAKGAARGS